MGTNYIAPIWRMPRNANKDKLSNYSLEFGPTTADVIRTNTTWQTDVGLDNVKKVSFSVWVNPNSGTGSSIMAVTSQAYGTWNGNFNITYRADISQLALEFRGAGSIFTNNSTTLAGDTWHHICFVLDLTLGGTIAQEVRCFVNNSEVANQSSASPPLNFVLQTTSFNIGRTIWGSGGSGYQWQGKITQACFFDYTLSESQIEYLYNLNNPMAITGAEPAAYWPLGDNSNPNAPGSFPNISVGADSVFEFGTQDYIEYPYVNIDSAFTVSTWVKTTDTSTYGNLFGSSNQFGGGPNIFNNWKLFRWNRSARFNASNSSNSIIFDVNTGTSGTRPNLYDGEWHHVVGIWDGTTNANGVKIFFDGVLRGLGTATSTAINTDSSIPIRAGSSLSNFDFIGEQANQQLFDTALTYGSASSDGDIAGGQVAELYNNGQPLMTGTQPQEANLQAWYKLNQSANWEADTTGNWQIPDAVSAYPQSFDFVSADGDRVLVAPVDAGTGPINSINGAMTVAIWVKTTQGTVYEYAINRDYVGGSNRDWNLFKDNFYGGGGRMIWSLFNTVGTNLQVRLTGSTDPQGDPLITMNDGKWHHIVGVYNGIDTAELYTDGVLQGSATSSGFGTLRTNARTVIGGYNNSGNPYAGGGSWNGGLSNAQIWNTNLSSTQVETLYNNGVPLTTAIASDNLKGWWKLDNTETYLKPPPSQTQNLYEAWLIKNQKYPASVDKCLLFANQNYIRYDNFDLINEAELTLSFWYLHDQSINSSDKLIGSYDSVAYNFIVNVNRSGIGGVSGILRTNDGSGGFINNSFSFGDVNTPAVGWRLLTVTYNGSVIKAYVNDEEVDSVSATGTIYDLNPYVGGSRNYNQSIRDGLGSANGMRLSNVIYWNKSLTEGELTTLYNNGTPLLTKESIPQESSMLLWNTLENKTETVGGGLYDKSGNSISIQTIGNSSTIIVDNVPVSAESVLSSGMTEQNLVNNNVSVLNGESSGMNTTNLVQSNLTRKVPFSNYSFNFDSASSDRIEISDNNIFSFGNGSSDSPFSISAWVNFDNVSSSVGIISKYANTTATREWLFYIAAQNFRLLLQDGSYNNFATATSTTISTNQWYHVVGTYNGVGGANANQGMNIYVNGQPQTLSYAGSSLYVAMDNTNAIVRIASYGAGGYMDGNQSNIAIFDRVLNQDEVLNIYNNGVPQDLKTTSSFSNNLVAWWPMDGSNSYYDGTNWVVRDLENGNDGTGVNTGNVDDLVGNAPGSDANGTGTNLTIADLKGNMYNSDKNAYSINMADYADGVTNPANSGRSTDTP